LLCGLRAGLLLIAVAVAVGEGRDAQLQPEPAALGRLVDRLLLPQLGVEGRDVLVAQTLLG
jgi:hypothetical protein